MRRCRIDTLEMPGRLAGTRWNMKGAREGQGQPSRGADQQRSKQGRAAGKWICQLVPWPARLIKSQSVGQTETPMSFARPFFFFFSFLSPAR